MNAYIKQLKTLYLSALGTPVIIALYFILTLSESPDNSIDNEMLLIFTTASIIFSLTAFVMSLFIPSRILNNNLKPDTSLEQKISLYRSYFIIRLALSEFSAFSYVLFLFVSKHQIFVILFFAFTILVLLTFKPPKAEQIIKTLKLSNQEVAQFN